jgi:hypothetical protein
MSVVAEQLRIESRDSVTSLTKQERFDRALRPGHDAVRRYAEARGVTPDEARQTFGPRAADRAAPPRPHQVSSP